MCSLSTLVTAGQPVTFAIRGDSAIALANAAAAAEQQSHESPQMTKVWTSITTARLHSGRTCCQMARF